jgi:hypothetical protein
MGLVWLGDAAYTDNIGGPGCNNIYLHLIHLKIVIQNLITGNNSMAFEYIKMKFN